MLYSWHFSKLCRNMKMLSMVDLFGRKPIWKYPSLFSIISVGYLAKLRIFYRLCLVVLLACSHYSSAYRPFIYKLGKWFLHSIRLGEFLNSKCCRLIYVFSALGFFRHVWSIPLLYCPFLQVYLFPVHWLSYRFNYMLVGEFHRGYLFSHICCCLSGIVGTLRRFWKYSFHLFSTSPIFKTVLPLVSLQVVGKINCWVLKVFISWKNFLVSFLLWLYSICNIFLFIHAFFPSNQDMCFYSYLLICFVACSCILLELFRSCFVCRIILPCINETRPSVSSSELIEFDLMVAIKNFQLPLCKIEYGQFYIPLSVV